MIVGKQELPANNAKELIAWLKAKPEPATAAERRRGLRRPCLRALFRAADRHQAAIRVLSRGAPAMQDMLAGTIDTMCAEASQTLAHVTAQQDESLRRDGATRYAGLPDVPTMEEMGISGMDILVLARAVATKGTPKDVIDKLNAAAVKALGDPDVQKRVAALGMTIPDKAQLTPQALHDFHKAEVDKWWPIIKSYDIKIQ